MRFDRELSLPEGEAQAAILVRAIEEADPSGSLLTHDERRRTAVAARAASRGPEVEKWIGLRSRAVVDLLEDRLPKLRALLRSTRLGRGLMLPAVVLAFIAGLASNALGPSQRIQVLAVPLLGVIAWNLASMAFLVLRRWLLGFILPPRSMPWILRLLRSLARRSLGRHGSYAAARWETDDEAAAGRRDLLQRALRSYLERWFPAVATLAAARLSRVLHVSALVLVAGVVAGMYLRGLALEYRVTWESTFLGAEQVESFLGWVLAPAVALLDAPWPPQPLEEIRTPPYGDAAPWIHLYAVTAALLVGVPRALLALFESFRARRLGRRLRLKMPEAYLRRLAAATATEARRIEILPYSHRPSGKQLEVLKKLLIDFFGPRSDVRLGKTLDYGSEIGELEDSPSDDAACCVLLFPLSQTPEVEVHGELLEKWKERFAGSPALVAVVDGSTYRERLGVTADSDRLAERRRTWDRVLRDAGIEAVHLDLGAAIPDEALTRLTSAAWPRGALGDAA